MPTFKRASLHSTANKHEGSPFSVSITSTLIILLTILSIGMSLLEQRSKIRAISTSISAPPSQTSDPNHLSVRDFGAVCDGAVDDTAALKRAFNYHNYHVELPVGATCAFKSAPLILDRPFGSITGAGMWGTSRLLYIGTNTNTDLVQIGSGRTIPSGLTSTGYSSLSGFTIESAVKMIGGYAIHEMGTQFVTLDNIALGRQQDPVNLWGGFHFDQTDWTRLSTFFVAAQDDCIAVSGHGAEGHPATGPQYDLWVDGGRIQGCHIGVHAGGGFDGALFDHMMVTGVDYDAVIDNALSPHPNQEILFGPQFFADFARYDNFLIDDPLCQQRVLCSVTINGPMLHAGAEGAAGVTNGSHHGEPPPPLSGNGIHIKAYPGGYVHVQSPYIQGSRMAGVLIEDQRTFLFTGSSTNINGSPYGITASAPFAHLAGMPSFTAIKRKARTNVLPPTPEQP